MRQELSLQMMELKFYCCLKSLATCPRCVASRERFKAKAQVWRKSQAAWYASLASFGSCSSFSKSVCTSGQQPKLKLWPKAATNITADNPLPPYLLLQRLDYNALVDAIVLEHGQHGISVEDQGFGPNEFITFLVHRDLHETLATPNPVSDFADLFQCREKPFRPRRIQNPLNLMRKRFGHCYSYREN